MKYAMPWSINGARSNMPGEAESGGFWPTDEDGVNSFDFPDENVEEALSLACRASRSAIALAFDFFALTSVLAVSSWKKTSILRSYPGHWILALTHLSHEGEVSSH